MLDLPSIHAAGALLFTVLVFVLFAQGKVKTELVSLGAIAVIALGLYISPFPGQARKDGLVLAFAGFGHTALITICSLMIMGRGLVVTGALDPAARLLERVWKLNTWFGLLVTLIAAMGLSMVVNDTPVLVLMIPVMAQLAARGAMATSKTLMPLNAAILIGGMGTTIGTSTNLLVVSLASDLGMQPLGIFHFTPVVLAAGAIALPYIWLVMPRLMKDNSSASGHEPRQFLATLRLVETSPLIGKDVAAARSEAGDLVLEGLSDDDMLRHGMRLDARGAREQLHDASTRLGLSAAPVWLFDRLRATAEAEREDLVEAEMAITRDSRLIGLTLPTSGIEDVAVLGIDPARPSPHAPSWARAGARRPSAEGPLAEGDILLAMGTPGNLDRFARSEGLLVLDGIRELPRSAKSALALAIMGTAVALATLGILPIAISALGGAIAMLATGCVRFDRIGRALSGKVIVLVAASLAIGRVMLESGGAKWLGDVLAIGLQVLPAWGVLAAVMLFVTLLTNFASNATAAAVGTPIAFSLAEALNLPVEPLVLAVLFGCNLCYATPVAYQTNMLIMAEGDYDFRDYLRAGVPLVLIMVVALAVGLKWRYGL